MPRMKIFNLFKRTSKSWTVNEGHINDGFVNDKYDKGGGRGVNNGPGSVSTSTQLSTHPSSSSSSQDASNWEKLKLLLWKNCKLQIRHKLQTFFEIFLPIFFTILVVVVRCIIETKVVDHPVTFPSFRVDQVPATAKLCCNEIYYAPNNSIVNELISRIETQYFNSSNFGSDVKFTGFSSEDELAENYHLSISSLGGNNESQSSDDNSHDVFGGDGEESSPVLAGIVFTNDFSEGGQEFPANIQYKLRFPATPRTSSDLFGDRFGIKKIWFTEVLYPIVQLLGPRAVDQPTGGVPGYYDEGFLYLQQAVESTLMMFLSKNDSILDSYTIKLQRFPYPPHIDDKFLYTLQGVLPLTLILSFIFPIINITKLVLVEKEKRLKEYMKMMGLPNWLHWTAWFIKAFLFLAISVLIITILLKIRVTESQTLPVLPRSDPTLVYVALMTHIFQLVCFSFFVSTLFKTANSAAIVAAVLWFLFFIPFAFVQPRYNKLSRFEKVGWSFGANIGMCFCCQLFCMFEGTGVGIQWGTIWQGATPDDTFCLADCMLMMIFNGLFYFALTIYTESVFPGVYGSPLPWYFPFTKWYWTGDLRQAVAVDNLEESYSLPSSSTNEFFEPITAKCRPGIQIKGLTKKFGDSKVAVKNLNLNMYEDEVFVLIGHNAAGKTTTMSVLAGIFPPTSGTALINGVDICKDMKTIRRSLGLCPQANILFSELTVVEHLRFYCILKGMKKSEIEPEVKRMLIAIGLEKKKDDLASALSGGMKRKLSVGIAFCAKSKVVLLDEPSSGLDVGARRSIWDLIQSEKVGRTIILCTHYMDEADVLADRIAIMAEGELQCCGTSLFLKKKYGCGYHLVIVKDNIKCNVEKITNILRSKLVDVEEEQNVGAELSYALPDNKSHLFAEVFGELEERKVELGIASYGASITTMEEVFMRVGQLLFDNDKRESNDSLPKMEQTTQKSITGKNPSNKKSFKKQQSEDVQLNVDVTFLNGSKMSLSPKSDTTERNDYNSDDVPHNTGITLRLQQFWAMMCKKVIFTKRKYGLLLGQIAICVIYPSTVLLIMTTIPGLYDPTPRPIIMEDYENFGHTVTTIHCPDESPVCQGYKKYLGSKQKVVLQTPENGTAEEDILRIAEKDVTRVNFKYFIGFEENVTDQTTELIGLFNNQPLHTPPLSLNFITNGILNSLPSYNNTTAPFQIQVTNHPFGYGANFEELGSYFTIGFQVGLHYALALGFMVAVYTIFPIKERNIRSKHLQFVSGVNFVVFWVSNFLVDLATYFLPCLTMHLILIGFQVQDFYSVTVQLYLLLLFYCYAFAVFPMLYLSSLYFRISSSGLVGMGVFNVLTGYATLFVGNIVSNPELDKDSLATILHRIFLIFPTYALGKGITQISLNYQVGKACDIAFLELLCETPPDKKSYLNWCCTKLKPNYLDWEELGIGKNLVYLVVFGLTCWILLLIIDSGLFSSTFARFKKKIEHIGFKSKSQNGSEESKSFGNEDEDVKNERRRIENTNMEQLSVTDNLIIRDLTKIFPNRTLAVDCLSLGIKKGECFGLLGANGAGKTSTFQMLTGELDVTSGDAFVYGHGIRTEIQKAHMNMGYCPQTDSLIDEMTGRETLWMYARLRGIPERKIHKVITKLADDLLFTEFLDRVVDKYSGGNKRKLSTAVALVGNPPIIFLDEPTCGIDPIARRELWGCIARARDAGTSVILTSHSMEETEFLCTRLAIMVNGRFRCLGSPQQLKSKFGEGYTLTAQTTVNDIEESEEDTLRRRRVSLGHTGGQEAWRSKLGELRTFIETSLPGSTLEDIHQGFLHYRVQGDSVKWADMFTVMEIAKKKFGLEAYSVGQTSLEQVFLNFIRAQYNSEVE